MENSYLQQMSPMLQARIAKQKEANNSNQYTNIQQSALIQKPYSTQLTTLKNNVQGQIKNNSATVNTNALERTPIQDSVKIKSKINKKKILIGIGLGLATLAAVIACYRKLSADSLNKIEKRFDKLYNDLPNSQSKLQQIFMRDDITQDETLSILKKYEEIEKAGLSQPKEDYLKSLFEHVKKCFGFEKSDIELVFKDLSNDESSGILQQVGGKWSPKDNSVFIDSKNFSKKSCSGTIHHELRHAKQEELIEMYLCKLKITQLLQNNFAKDSKGFKTFEEYINANWTQEFQSKFLEEYKFLFRNNFPLLKDYQFDKTDKMKKIIETAKKFDTGTKERKMQLEWDARYAEDMAGKMFGYGINHITKIIEKLGLVSII